jgi:PAS domain S-box-containing protein
MTPVLVVDDSPTQAKELRLVLEPAGFSVTLASDAAAGIRELESGGFEIIISNNTIPGTSGYDFCMQVKTDRRWREIPVILLTTLSDPMDIIQGLECGADNFVTTPFDPANLTARIRNILENRRMRAEGKPRTGVETIFLGRKFTVNPDREKTLDLLISTFEETVRTNQELRASRAAHSETAEVLRGLTRVAAGLNSAKTVEEVLDGTLARALELPGIRAGWVSLREETGEFRLAAAAGLPPGLAEPGTFEGDCTCRRMLLSGELDRALNILECERIKNSRGDTSGLRCHASIPLWVGRRKLGVMDLAGPGEGVFQEDVLAILHGIGNQVGVALDRVRLQTQLEGRVRMSEEKYHHLMESAGDAILIHDLDLRILEVNHQAEILFGRPRSDLVGRSPVEFIAQDQRGMEQGWQEKLLKEGVLRIHEVRHEKPGGEQVWCDVSVTLVTVGEERLAFAIVRDVTERNRLERQFHQAQKMDAVGRLAGGVAHDFNNLLTVISGYANFLEEGVREDPRLATFVGEIDKAANRAATLVRQLLAFSRKQIVSPRVLNPNVVVSDMGNMLRRLIGEDVELVTVLAPDLWSVETDPAQIDQVIMNLAVNARDAMPDGGSLTIETGNVEIDEERARSHMGLAPGPHVLLAVSDTGTGMDEDTQAHIFEPFFTTKGEGKGTGLGLATVYGVVKQNRGSIYVYSEPGHGTTFKLYLPRARGEAEAMEPAAAMPGARGGPETILVVEDNPQVRRFVCSALGGFGYRVLEADGSAAAVALCEGEAGGIDLMVTDVVMPEMSGRKLALRLEAVCPRMKVLYISGYTDSAITNHGILERGLSFLQKPFSSEALARRVREILDAAHETGGSRVKG